MKSRSHLLKLCLILVMFGASTIEMHAQSYKTGKTVIVNGATGLTKSGEHSTFAVIGEPFSGNSKALQNRTSLGLWGLLLNAPSSPNLNASEGDFSDKVVLSWQLETLSPAPGEGYHVFRDGTLLARVGTRDTSYTDTNVKPGIFYSYTITAINNFGESVLGTTTGFVNPNGVITGTISTSKKTPVSEVEVSLTPIVGQSLSFDGVDDKFQLEDIAILNGNVDTAFTFSTWVNASSTGTDRMIGGGQFLDGSGASYPFSLQTTGGKFAATVTTSSGTSSVTGTTTFASSQWYHLALVYSPTNGVQLFVDAVLEASQSITGSINTASAFIVGQDIDQSTGIANWDGLIDEIRLWNIARSVTSIQNDKDRTISGSADNLVGYWRLDEGTGTLAFDLTSNKEKANLTGATYSSSHANLPASALTDSLGNYKIEGIFYGAGTTFDVTPTKPLHTFTPALRQATLNTSNTGVNNVTFEDDSQLAVEGFIKFAGTECFEEKVEILIDGKSTIPKTFTNNKGEYVVEFEPGSSAVISPKKGDHPFSPISYVVDNINEPVAGIEFIDNDLVDLTVHFAGGACRFPIGKATVTVRTEDGCFNRSVETSNSGFVTLRNIPSNKYEVILKPENPNITFDGIQVDLSAGSDTVEFIYRSPLKTEIELLTNARRVNDIPVLRMAAEGQDTTRFRMSLFEEYHNVNTGALNICYLDTGSVKVIDKISKKDITETLVVSNPDITRKDSMPEYDLIVGRPNFLDGGSHPYQKELQVVGKDTTGREVTGEFWAYVEGHKTEGNTFITTAPNRPLFILRDPPGDKSYAEITKEYALSYTNRVSVKFEEEKEFENVEMGGIDELEGEGILIETLEEQRQENQTGEKTTYGASVGSRSNISFQEVLRTDESAESADGKHDIIAGAAQNYLYGVTKTLKVNADGTVEIDKRLGIEPKGFKTFYYYTTGFIEEVLIPNIEASDLDDEEKEKQIDNWERHLLFHNQLTEQNFTQLLSLPQNLPQLLFKENVSFSGGAPYEAEAEYESVSSIEWEDEIDIVSEISDQFITKAAGSGDAFKTKLKTTYSEGDKSEIEYEGTTKTKIVLEDATEGDAFSVGIETDVLGFPLFKIKGGQSTTPWEKNTSRRDKVSLTLDSYQAVNVPPTGTAEFTLNVGNESETDEERLYEVRLIPESNPNGAVLKIGGKTLPATNSFTIQAGETVQAELTVERGPEAFEYDSLKLMAYAPGQYDLWLTTQNREFLDAVDTVSFNVQFSESCGSDVQIANFDNFIINRFDTTAYPVQVFGYNPNDADFDQLLLEYQHVGEDFWIIADSIGVDSIGPRPFIFMPWEFKDLQDGAYNLRIKSLCSNGSINDSNILTGIMDRSNPGIFGEPTPANNGALGFNQQISITFTEEIDTTTLFVDRIRLFNTEEDREIPMSYSSDGRTVILTPQEQNRFIEGVRLRAEIDTLADIHGNWITSPITWEFEVDRNPIRWNQKALSEAVFTNNSTEYSIPLRNLSLQTTPFTITDVPDWLSVSPVEGDIGANGKIDINITVKDDINFGSYLDTLNVNTTEGNEPLQLNIRALQQPPNWTVDPLEYQYQMSAIGKITLRDVESTDQFDIIAAFVGEECRGVASPELVEETGEYMVFLTIYSNQASGEDITIRLWDAEDAEEYWKLQEEFSFNSNSTTGSLTSPLNFQSSGDITQRVPLNKGWSWFSGHLNSSATNMSINNILSDQSFSDGDRIVYQNGFEAWSVNSQRWIPGKLVFDPQVSYQVFLDSTNAFTFIGQEIDPTSLTQKLAPGNNWLGYPLRRNIPINTALQNLAATEGSVIRNQISFSEYLGGSVNKWIGSLHTLRAGEGYIYSSSATDTLSFAFQQVLATPKSKVRNLTNDPMVDALPISKSGVIKVGQKGANGDWDIDENIYQHTDDASGLSQSDASSTVKQSGANQRGILWELNVHEKQYNMPVILNIDKADADTNWYVGAFIEDELAGLARISSTEIGDNFGFLMVYHHSPKAGVVQFKLFNPVTNQLIKVDEQAAFDSNGKVGSLETPLTLSIEETGELPTSFALSQNYPNPFNPSTNFRFDLPKASNVTIDIYNVLGQKVATLVNSHYAAGSHIVTWNAGGAGMASGMYLAEMRVDGFRQIRKMMLIK